MPPLLSGSENPVAESCNPREEKQSKLHLRYPSVRILCSRCTSLLSLSDRLKFVSGFLPSAFSPFPRFAPEATPCVHSRGFGLSRSSAPMGMRSTTLSFRALRCGKRPVMERLVSP